MHWQGKSVQFDELAFVPAQTTFISRQRDRTRCANRVSKFLQGMSESVSGAVTIDPGQYCGGRQCTALDCQRELHELRIVFPDQRPIDRAAEKRVDLCVTVRVIGPVQRQLLPAPDSRHQFNSQQVCQAEDSCRLAMGTKANQPRFQATNSDKKPMWQVFARILPAGLMLPVLLKPNVHAAFRLIPTSLKLATS